MSACEMQCLLNLQGAGTGKRGTCLGDGHVMHHNALLEVHAHIKLQLALLVKSRVVHARRHLVHLIANEEQLACKTTPQGGLSQGLPLVACTDGAIVQDA